MERTAKETNLIRMYVELEDLKKKIQIRRGKRKKIAEMETHTKYPHR